SRARAQRAVSGPLAQKDAEAHQRLKEPVRTAAVNGRTEAEPIHFHCEACRRLLRIPATHQGKRFRCPECGTVSRIPEAPEPVVESVRKAPSPTPPKPAPPAEEIIPTVA